MWQQKFCFILVFRPILPYFLFAVITNLPLLPTTQYHSNAGIFQTFAAPTILWVAQKDFCGGFFRQKKLSHQRSAENTLSMCRGDQLCLHFCFSIHLHQTKNEVRSDNRWTKRRKRRKISCQKLLSVAKSCYQLPKLAISCLKLPSVGRKAHNHI